MRKELILSTGAILLLYASTLYAMYPIKDWTWGEKGSRAIEKAYEGKYQAQMWKLKAKERELKKMGEWKNKMEEIVSDCITQALKYHLSGDAFEDFLLARLAASNVPAAYIQKYVVPGIPYIKRHFDGMRGMKSKRTKYKRSLSQQSRRRYTKSKKKARKWNVKQGDVVKIKLKTGQTVIGKVNNVDELRITLLFPDGSIYPVVKNDIYKLYKKKRK